MSATSHPASGTTPEGRPSLSRIGVGVDNYPEGRDAAALGAALARATGAELMLIAVHAGPLVVLPSGMDWHTVEREAYVLLARVRDELGCKARTVVETDLSVARALHRVVQREHRDLLVVGSSRHAPEGGLRIAKRTRQLLGDTGVPLAVAPRGLHQRRDLTIKRIGVGYDGGPEAEVALALAGSIARSAGAELHVRGVVDDRMPGSGWSYVWVGDVIVEWQQVLEEETASLRTQAEQAAQATGVPVSVEVVRGRPADRLLDLCSEVDLLVLGSRRWGPVARLLLGSTGEALMHVASCPVLVVPRPREGTA